MIMLKQLFSLPVTKKLTQKKSIMNTNILFVLDSPIVNIFFL